MPSPTPKAPTKAQLLEQRVAKLEADNKILTYLHAELSTFVKLYVAQQIAKEMAPQVQRQLQDRAMAQMAQGFHT